MRIRVLFFGVLRDIVGLREDSLELPEGGRLETVLEHYAGRFPRLREMSASVVPALNQQFSSTSAMLSEGEEVVRVIRASFTPYLRALGREFPAEASQALLSRKCPGQG